MRKNIITFATTAFVISTLAYFYFAEYNINDVNADNYKHLQVVYSTSVFRGSNTVFLNSDFFLQNAKNERSNSTYTFKDENAPDRDVFTITDNTKKDFWYTVIYDKKTKQPYYYSVAEFKIDDQPIYLPNIIRVLLEKGEFALKRTELIEGSEDILIKDLGDYFLIGRIGGTMKKPIHLEFQVYSKRKYFKNLHA